MSNIHIRIGYPEAISSKKEILYCEKSLIEVLKTIKSYSVLRKKEFTLKNKLKKDLSFIKNCVLKVENEMPKDTELNIPKEKIKKSEISLEEGKEKTSKGKKEKKKKSSKKNSLDKEIQEIEKKLAQLG